MLREISPRSSLGLLRSRCWVRSRMTTTRGYHSRGMAETPDADTRGPWSELIVISGAAGIDTGRAFGRPISKRA